MPDNPTLRDPAWIETYTGKKLHLLNPSVDEIDIRDIAHGLANQCRFTGQCKFFYSIAQHSIFASSLVPAQDALWALLHDASEAYLGDMNRPLKHYTPAGEAYAGIETYIMDIICLKFGISIAEPESVRKADNALLYAEKAQLMNAAVTWDTKWSESEDAAPVVIWRMPPEIAEKLFLRRFEELTS